MDIYEQLTRDEGDKRRVYYVPNPVFHLVPHVGIGHNLESGPELSDAAVQQILRDDVAVLLADIKSLAVWPTLSDARQGVLLNMGFNLGFAALCRFHDMLAALAAHDYQRAADAMLQSKWAIEVPERARRLAQQMRSDEWV